MKLVLGLEVDLSPPRRLCVRWGPHSPPQNGDRAPQIFGPCLLWPNDWLDEAGTWHRGRPQLRRFCVRWGPAPPSPKGGRAPPQFSAISIVAKRLDASRCHSVWMLASAQETLC